MLWALAALVAFLAAHVALGWMRQGQRATEMRAAWGPVLVGSAVLGTGLSASAMMGLASEPLPFSMGFRYVVALALWLGAMLAVAPVVYWLVRRPGALAYVGCGLLVAAIALALQVGWIWAAGMRPGVFWKTSFLATSGVTMAIGLTAAFAVANSIGARVSSHRTGWRLAGDVLAGLTVIAGQELTSSSAGLVSQIGSIYHKELPASVLALATGALLPIVLAIMALDLFTRRQLSHHQGRSDRSTMSFDRPRRRKHKHTVHPL